VGRGTEVHGLPWITWDNINFLASSLFLQSVKSFWGNNMLRTFKDLLTVKSNQIKSALC